MITFSLLSSAEYAQYRFSILSLTEGARLLPYADNAADGWATIGIGFNLSDENTFFTVVNLLYPMMTLEQKQELYDIADNAYGANNTMAVRKALNQKMAAFHSMNSQIPSAFSIPDSAQMMAIYNQLVITYEGRVNNFIPGIPESKERVALLSLSYNGGLGTNLKNAILNGNHAEAWYEIRYRTNGSQNAGLANRRYVEADTFDLYSGNVPTQNDAQLAAQMYTTHRDVILKYEATYSPTVAATKKGVASIVDIYHELQPSITTLKSAYGVEASAVIEEVQMATDAIMDLNGDGAVFNNVVYDTANNDQDMLIGSNVANILNGNAGNDVLLGLGGA